MTKKVLSLILAIALVLVALPLCPAVSAIEPPADGADIKAMIDRISAATEKLEELNNTAGAAKEISSAFQDFMKVAGYAGTALTAINGSITFLKLIGVIDDPIKSGVGNILDQLKTVNGKMSEMDAKLDNIASAMSTMQASAEFNNRGSKALSLRKAWNDFELNYMENKLDSMMTQYNGMLINGITAWCRNTAAGVRTDGGIDNSRIIVAYVPDKDGTEYPLYFAGNEIPEQYLSGCRYVILEKECLPDTFSFNVNDYQKKLAAAIADRIEAALLAENFDAFKTHGFAQFDATTHTETDRAEIERIAADAVRVLTYRVGCVEVNRDATFAMTVNDWFGNYCKHLLAADEGMDAMLKSIYLTHTFEFEAKKDIEDFINRMILKTGTYGTFLINILGMSGAITDSTKQYAMDTFCNAIEALQMMLDNSITGKNAYSYITNTELRYVRLTFSVKGKIHTEHIYKDKENYKYFECDKIRTEITGLTLQQCSALGDVYSMLLIYSLQNGGMGGASLHDYLNGHIALTRVKDYGNLVTSFNPEQTDFVLDGGIAMKPYTVIGNDFNGISSFKLTNNKGDYPDNAKPEYILHHKKVSGSIYDTATGKLSSNAVLKAVAVYGQTHWNWFFDEAAFFVGPAGYANTATWIDSDNDGKFEYDDYLDSETYYNSVVSIPMQPKLKQRGQYDPLASFVKLSEELEKSYPSDDPTSPKTGDTAPFLPIVGICVSAAVLLIGALRRKQYI